MFDITLKSLRHKIVSQALKECIKDLDSPLLVSKASSNGKDGRRGDKEKKRGSI